MKRQVLTLDPCTDQPEQENCFVALWRASLLQVILDATLTTMENENPKRRRIREQALHFVFTSTTADSDHYETVCGMANVDPGYFHGVVSVYVNAGERFVLRRDIEKALYD